MYWSIMHCVFSVKRVIEELLHHWSRFPSLSYFLPRWTQINTDDFKNPLSPWKHVLRLIINRIAHHCYQSHGSIHAPRLLRSLHSSRIWHKNTICELFFLEIHIISSVLWKHKSKEWLSLTEGSQVPRKMASEVLPQGILGRRRFN